jgi:acetate kinase
MASENGTVLVINSGSSSIKYQLLNPTTGNVLAVGLMEMIGETVGKVTHEVGDNETVKELPIPDHNVGLEIILGLFDEVGPSLQDSNILAVGHRVVQGGDYFPTPAVCTDETIDRIKQLIPLAPLHNPANVSGIEVAKKLLPNVEHVAVFDSSFFQTLPAVSSTYAINKAVAKKFQIKRYGAHGTSHQYVGSVVREMLNPENKSGFRQIVLHVGNGASASAQIDDRAIDTSMGLTPLEGLVMGTRSGDLDPAVVFHLARVGGYNIDQIDQLLNKESGMKGLCGSADMRDVEAKIAEGDADSTLAMDIYAQRLVKYIGSYTFELGGLAALTFTAGVGENAADLRAKIVSKLEPFGFKLDLEKNKIRSKEPRIISADDSAIKILVVPTNEELAIAKLSLETLGIS